MYFLLADFHRVNARTLTGIEAAKLPSIASGKENRRQKHCNNRQHRQCFFQYFNSHILLSKIYNRIRNPGIRFFLNLDIVSYILKCCEQERTHLNPLLLVYVYPIFSFAVFYSLEYPYPLTIASIFFCARQCGHSLVV